jgi:hypothetical protein
MLRSYENITNPQETAAGVTESFVPLISKLPGFVAYYFVDAGNGEMFSVSVYEDQAGAEASSRTAAEWVRDHPNLIPGAARVAGGEVRSNG